MLIMLASLGPCAFLATGCLAERCRFNNSEELGHLERLGAASDRVPHRYPAHA
jgi:hypothetical protein